MTWLEKYSTCALHTTASPKFSSVSLYDRLFSRYRVIVHFTIFPLTLMLKLQSAIFLTWPIAKKSNCLYCTMVANVLIKFGWYQMKTVGRVAFWNFQPHMILCLQKFQSCLFVLFFWQMAKKEKPISPMSNIFIIKFCWNRTESMGDVAFWNFGSQGVPC